MDWETLFSLAPLVCVALVAGGLAFCTLWRDTRYVRASLAPWWQRRRDGRRG
ncbi:hypothetical protein [Amycolatopsis thailandensis]|uniref:hypothetical protein n=1 Tax=Amycolatopsis thailandensis TaxID=589330 RepID=UPI00362E6D55